MSTTGLVSLVSAGQAFPDFSLQNQDDQPRTLASYRGRWLVAYVYPKDDTPGCTIQGKSFTATKAEYEKHGIQVVGISADDVGSHKSFCDKYSLAVELLADPQAMLLMKLGAGQTDYKGTLYWNRTTWLVDPAGVVRKVYTGVNPQGHERVVLNEILSMQN
jgi:peroxiredoxin Q/BCP